MWKQLWNVSLHEMNPSLGQTPVPQVKFPVVSVAVGISSRGLWDAGWTGSHSAWWAAAAECSSHYLVLLGRVLVSPFCRMLIILSVDNPQQLI